MKKLLFLLLSAASGAYAAESALVLSDDVIAWGDLIATFAYGAAYTESDDVPTGSVAECYARWPKTGYKALMANNPAAVAKALGYMAELSDQASENQTIVRATSCFRVASYYETAERAGANKPDGDLTSMCGVLPHSGFPTRLKVWMDELKAYSIALLELAEKDLPEDFALHPSAIQRILRNNGKTFDASAMTVYEGFLLAILGGQENRRTAMGEELFNTFMGNGDFYDSPAHQALKSISSK